VDAPFHHDANSSNDEISVTCAIGTKLRSQLVAESVEARCMKAAELDTLLEVEVDNWDERRKVSGTAAVAESFRTSADFDLGSCRTFELGHGGLSRTAEGDSPHIAEVEYGRSMRQKTVQNIVVAVECLVAWMNS
jgi:hypothetical protein